MNAFEPKTVVLHARRARTPKRDEQIALLEEIGRHHGVILSETQAARWHVGQWRSGMTPVVEVVDAPTAVRPRALIGDGPPNIRPAA